MGTDDVIECQSWSGWWISARLRVALATRCQGNDATQPINGRRHDGTWQVHSGGSCGVSILGAFATILNIVCLIIITLKPVFLRKIHLQTLILLDIINLSCSVPFRSYLVMPQHFCLWYTCKQWEWQWYIVHSQDRERSFTLNFASCIAFPKIACTVM